MASLFQKTSSRAALAHYELISNVTVPVKHVNVNMLWPNKDTLLTSIILYDEMRKTPLSISVRKTSSLIEGIRSTPNVKRVYPPEADRLASIHHKHNRFPLPKHSLIPPWSAVPSLQFERVQRCLFQLNATWCLGTGKVIFSWITTHCKLIKQGFSLWWGHSWTAKCE